MVILMPKKKKTGIPKEVVKKVLTKKRIER
jgi:hypothetical protein